MKSQSLNLNQALASGRLQEFVRHEEARGAELTKGSDFERALALLITKRRSGGAQTPVVIDGFEHPGARALKPKNLRSPSAVSVRRNDLSSPSRSSSSHRNPAEIAQSPTVDKQIAS